MTKKIITVLLCVLALMLAAQIIAQAIPFPAVTNSAVSYIDYANGSDDNSGTEASAPKKTLGKTSGGGSIGLVSGGGTLVLVGKCYVGADYTLPKLSSPLLITSKIGGVDHMNDAPISNPATAFKMKGGVTFSIQSDVIFDDVIIFQENARNTIIVKSGATLVIGENVKCMSKSGQNMKITVEAGGRAIINGGKFDDVGGDGEILYSQKPDSTTAPAVTAPAETTAPAPVAQATPDAVCFIDFSATDSNDGKTKDTAKKTFGSTEAQGAISVLAGGGTLVVSGKAYLGAQYTLPVLGGDLLITSNYGGVDYMNKEPETNPACAMKMISAVSFEIQSNVTFDNMILFQESKQNTIHVTNGATLTIGSGVVTMSKTGTLMKILVDDGATAIIKAGEFEFAGDGNIMVAEGGRFASVNSMSENTFSDITKAAWYYADVEKAYNIGLMNGISATKFSPDGSVSVAQAITIAARIHAIYNGNTAPENSKEGKWYDAYVSYAVDNSIIKAGQFDSYDREIKRSEMALIFAYVLPDGDYKEINSVTAIPDVKNEGDVGKAVYRLYNAGILSGSDAKGTFFPDTSIKRSETSAIINRIVFAESRKTLSF